MMYHCMDISRFRSLNVKILEQTIQTHLRELLDDSEKHAEKGHRGDDHAGRRNHVLAAGPGDLLHLHADIVEKFLGAFERAGHFACELVALWFFAIHFNRLCCHEPFSPARTLRFVSFEILAGEEGFEPPYPVLETGVLTVGRLPYASSSIRLLVSTAAPAARLRSKHGKLIWPLYEACACGTHGRTSWFPCARNASSCFSWWCNCDSCTHHTAT